MTPRTTRHRNRRLWYGIVGVVAVILVLLVIGWASGRFGGAAPPETAPASPPATTQ